MGDDSTSATNVNLLTDGGGQDRVDQSRSGLGSLVHKSSVHFLQIVQNSLYEALIRRDVEFLGLGRPVALLIGQTEADEVSCDSVEFYNPIHDLSLPIVRAAVPRTAVRVFEIPLVHQTSKVPGV